MSDPMSCRPMTTDEFADWSRQEKLCAYCSRHFIGPSCPSCEREPITPEGAYDRESDRRSNDPL